MEYTFKYLQQGIYIHLYIRNNIHLQENIVWYHDIHHNIHHIYYMSWYSPGIFVDLGIYGWSPLPNWAGKDPTLRMFEKFTLKHGGYQVFSGNFDKKSYFFSGFLSLFKKSYFFSSRACMLTPWCPLRSSSRCSRNLERPMQRWRLISVNLIQHSKVVLITI